MSLVKVLRRDPKYKQVRSILETAKSRIDIQRDKDEAFALHLGLEARSLYGRRVYSPKAVLSATAQLQANRSRLVELRARCSEHISYLEQACARYRRYAMSAYSEDFKEYRTKEQRDSVLGTVLMPALDFVAETETLISIFDTFIRDIDQAGHSIRHIVDVLKLLDSSRLGKTI